MQTDHQNIVIQRPAGARPVGFSPAEYPAVPSGAEHLTIQPVETIVRRILLTAVFGLSLIGGIRLASVSTETLVARVIIDDAFYYVVPAQHLIEGKGYSFDGELRTNGVQPLWAAIVVVLAAILPHNTVILHVVVLLSGLFWIGAGAILYRALSKSNLWFALLVASGWLLTGFWNRLAFQGMENGLHGFVFACILAYGIRYLRLPSDLAAEFDTPAFYLKLGFLLALFALTRIDSALLALLMGIAVVLGFLRPGGFSRLRLNLSGAIWLALPGMILCGGTLLCSWCYFATATPISAHVKYFLEKSNGPLHGGALSELYRHLNYLWDISTWALAGHLENTLWSRLLIAWPCQRTKTILLLVLIIGLSFGLHQLWSSRRFVSWRPTPYRCFVAVIAAFVVIHFCTYAIGFPHFTGYGTWYFSGEIMSLWLLYGLGIVLFGRAISDCFRFFSRTTNTERPSRIPGFLAGATSGLMIAVSVLPVCFIPERDAQHSAFFKGAQWLTKNLPAGQKIGAFSSGILSYFTPSHQVINLDGLMNDRHYFENYLKPAKIPQYIRHRGIDYFADYSTKAGWRSVYYWGLDLKNMQLVAWWPMGGDHSYGIWKILPEGQRVDTLDPCNTPCNRISQIQYAAQVLDRFEVVEEDRLAAALRSANSAGKRLFTSIVDPETRKLAHVFVPRDLVPTLGLTRENCKGELAVNVVFGNSVELLGVDLPSNTVFRNRRMVITRYWTLAQGKKVPEDYVFELTLGKAGGTSSSEKPAARQSLHCTRACYGTYPVSSWHPGELVVETYSIPIPAQVKPGNYPLMLTVKDESGKILPSSQTDGESSACFLANIEVD